MRRLVVFNHVSLDGYFVDASGDMSWVHKQDAEWTAFTAENATGGGALVFGRITYDMMAGFWPTPQAMQTMPIVAERMNQMPKVVFSRTLADPAWKNTTVVKDNIVAEMGRMKTKSGPSMTILGSGSIVSQFAQEGLIDEYQIVVNPIVLGQGRTLFDGIQKRLLLKLTKSRTFANGNILLSYRP